MTHDAELAAVTGARERLAASNHADPQAYEAVALAERRLAAARGEPWAEPLRLPATWDSGAPLPHLVSNGTRTDLICYAANPDPNWDGMYVTVRSPGDEHSQHLLRLTFHSCQSIKFGGPNDEVLHAHPLSSRGLTAYQAHVVHNSRWIADEEAINSGHPNHQDDQSRRGLVHYFLVFHDETFEALAERLEVHSGVGTMARWLHDAVTAAINR